MNKFYKEERLCSKKLLDLLFKKGSSFLLYPYRATFVFEAHSSKFPAQVVINVAKKRYKHAHDRNLIKRRTREAYRLQKNTALYELLPNNHQLLLLGLQYVGKEIYPYTFLEKRMAQLFKKLLVQISNESN
ncbi:ribonuclease P protein component [Pedobacter sp. SL55]|uniref:ribonuclease P protein component n=1 Tax=Pedobacter sp. SL55 TaxID=2995161 RepID=UPI00226DC5F2|nr:ribonuclease P protein component [Pedobacter sp. SL55]WAC40894.1 ribonuclease P protein component [Pedobacter sp. SL55]